MCIYGDTDEAQATLLHREVDGIIASLYNNKDMFNQRDSSTLFQFPAHVRMKHHAIKHKFLWIKMDNIAVQAWHNEGVITRAWLHLAH